MASRFEKFSERARRVLSLSQEEALRFNHNYIGTEHILLGLVRETEGVAARVLSNLGIELSKVRSAVEFIIGRGEKPVSGENIGLTPRAKRVIELAVDEARRMSHHYIGTEHLLIGLMREGEGVAAGVLESSGRHAGQGSCGNAAAAQPEHFSWPATGPRRRRHNHPHPHLGPVGRRPDGPVPQQQAGPGLGPPEGVAAGRADPLPPDQEQPRAHGRARRRQDRHRGGACPEDYRQ